jgi:single-stranded DNA-binding protein
MLNAELALIGKLVNPPEQREGRNGEMLVALHLLVPDLGKRDGPPEAAWSRVTLFGEVAETAIAELARGDLVFCRGTPTLDRWSDRITGDAKFGLSMVATETRKLGVTFNPTAGIETPPPDACEEPAAGASPKSGPADKPKKRVWHGMRLKFEPRQQNWQAPLDEQRGDDLSEILGRRS